MVVLNSDWAGAREPVSACGKHGHGAGRVCVSGPAFHVAGVGTALGERVRAGMRAVWQASTQR